MNSPVSYNICQFKEGNQYQEDQDRRSCVKISDKKQKRKVHHFEPGDGKRLRCTSNQKSDRGNKLE
jgi:hypothetical protein